MTSEQFADHVTECVESLRSRILGTGQEQYSMGDRQKIEDYSNTQLLDEAIAELDDFVVYAVYMRTRMAELRSALH
jgi:hypothetical protein